MNKDPLKTGKPDATPLMSAHDFAQWGVEHVAYIKPVEINGGTLFAVFAANGQQLGLMETPDMARAAAIQNDLEPLSVH
ncbi:MAG: hypothetical protein CMM60_07680 [Rhodospirillaceae bacterium]|jgi:hypothetical protein|nr:hypothetical protein [Rhodospirillaceae bacterium]|tara:strand:+ start:725 stop:961 length:237 start_codon:yes stop_codon:yes gene_type:complete